MVVNKKFWDGLPADIRGQLDKAMKEATAYSATASRRRKTTTRSPRSRSPARREIIVPLTAEQDAAMRKALEPVYQDVASRVGQPLIDDVPQGDAGRRPTNNVIGLGLFERRQKPGPVFVHGG